MKTPSAFYIESSAKVGGMTFHSPWGKIVTYERTNTQNLYSVYASGWTHSELRTHGEKQKDGQFRDKLLQGTGRAVFTEGGRHSRTATQGYD